MTTSSDNTVPQSVLPDYDWSGFRRVLVVVAHPDDAEYGLSCAVAMWTRAGVEVGYLLITHGEAGIRHMDPAEVGQLRAEEQRAACAAVGVSELTVLDHPDGQLMESMKLRRDIAEHIRKFRPDTVITANFEVEAYGTFNQADHRVAGLMAVDAVRDADNPWVHRDLDLPAHGTDRFLVVNPGEPTHRIVVDEESHLAGVESLKRHRVYLEALPDHPKPEEFIPEMLAQADGEHAVSFRVFEQI